MSFKFENVETKLNYVKRFKNGGGFRCLAEDVNAKSNAMFEAVYFGDQDCEDGYYVISGSLRKQKPYKENDKWKTIIVIDDLREAGTNGSKKTIIENDPEPDDLPF